MTAESINRLAAGKTVIEAMRWLKRRLSNVVFQRMLADANRRIREADGGDTHIQRSQLNPDSRLFGQSHYPDPTTTLRYCSHPRRPARRRPPTRQTKNDNASPLD